jgi:hypothetical protein
MPNVRIFERVLMDCFISNPYNSPRGFDLVKRWREVISIQQDKLGFREIASISWT